MSSFTQHKKIIMGRFGAPHGIKGAIKLHSWSTPTENIFNYSPWYLKANGEWRTVAPKLLSQGNHLITAIEDISDREAAATLTNLDIYVDRTQLPQLSPGQYYWSDLAGMDVMTECKNMLGKVAYVFNTGSNDILAVQGERERMLPFLPETVVDIDMHNNTILVNWDPSF